MTYSFRLHNGPGVDSAPSENEYQEHFLGVEAADAWGWRPHHLHVPNVMKIWEPKPPGTLWATSGLLWDSYFLRYTSAWGRSIKTWLRENIRNLNCRQHTATYTIIQQHTAAYSNIQQNAATYSNIQQHTATYSNIQQHTAECSNIQQHTAAYNHIQQHTATYSSIQQHTATYSSIHPAYISIQQHTATHSNIQLVLLAVLTPLTNKTNVQCPVFQRVTVIHKRSKCSSG